MSKVVMLYLGSLMFRSLCVGLLAFVGTLFLRSVAKRHAAWVAVLVIMLLMPVLDAILPPSLIPAPLQRIAVGPMPIALFENDSASVFPVIPSSPPAALEKTSEIDWWKLALALYGSVATTLLIRLAWAYSRLRKLKASSRRITAPAPNELAGREIPLFESEAVRVPLTGGFTRPFVLLPAGWKTWDEWKLRAVLAHELTHIRRGDCMTTVLAAINAGIFWFNPLAWWLERQLVALAEKASDDTAVLLAGDHARYAELLLEFVAAAPNGRRLRIGGVAMAKSGMRSRIERVLSIQQPKNGILTKAGWVVVLIVTMPALYAAAVVHVAPQPPAQALVSPLAAWLEKVAAVITIEERTAFESLQSDPERRHFIEQFWSRRFPTWPDEVAYLIRDEERVAYNTLKTDAERRRFIQQFWLRMDPSSGTPENEFKNDYYRRLEYVSRAFAQPSGWWKTDRGRIYIMYGQPDQMDSYAAGGIRVFRGGQTAPYPFVHWRYLRIDRLGDNVMFNFVDPAGTGEFLLTSPGVRPIVSDRAEANAIEDVWIRGNRDIPSDAVKSYLQTKRGDQLNLILVNSDLEKLYSLGYFEDVYADITGGPAGGRIVTFDLREKLLRTAASSAAQPQSQSYQRGDSVRLHGVLKPAVFKIVGIPADWIRADQSGVYVNDVPVTGFTPDFTTRFTREPSAVPNGHYFVMGEQRVNDDISENMSLVPESSLERIR